MAKPARPEQSLINHVIRYADGSGCSQSGVTYKDAVIGCCDHIIGLAEDPYGGARHTFLTFADAQADAARVKAWVIANM